MKYIRTKDGILNIDFEISNELPIKLGWQVQELNEEGGMIEKFKGIEVLKQADTIEELCDEFVVKYGDCSYDLMQRLKWAEMEEYNASLVGNGGTIYGAIWTDKGLIYVAKMNEKGELELL